MNKKISDLELDIPQYKIYKDKYNLFTWGYIRTKIELTHYYHPTYAPNDIISYISFNANHWKIILDLIKLTLNVTIYNWFPLYNLPLSDIHYVTTFAKTEIMNGKILNAISCNILTIESNAICQQFLAEICKYEIAYQIFAIIFMNTKQESIIRDISTFLMCAEDAYSKYNGKSLFRNLIKSIDIGDIEVEQLELMEVDQTEYTISELHACLFNIITMYRENPHIMMNIWNLLSSLTQNVNDYQTKRELVTEIGAYQYVLMGISRINQIEESMINTPDLLLMESILRTLLNLISNNCECEDEIDFRHISETLSLALSKMSSMIAYNQTFIVEMQCILNILIHIQYYFISDDEYVFEIISRDSFSNELIQQYLKILSTESNVTSRLRVHLSKLFESFTTELELLWVQERIKFCIESGLIQIMIANCNNNFISSEQKNSHLVIIANIFCYPLNVIKQLVNDQVIIRQLLQIIVNEDILYLDAKEYAFSIIRNILSSNENLKLLRESIIQFEHGKLINCIIYNVNKFCDNDNDSLRGDVVNDEEISYEYVLDELHILSYIINYMDSNINSNITHFIIQMLKQNYIGNVIQNSLGFIDYNKNVAIEYMNNMKISNYIISAISKLTNYEALLL